jgi:hypothetical protein
MRNDKSPILTPSTTFNPSRYISIARSSIIAHVSRRKPTARGKPAPPTPVPRERKAVGSRHALDHVAAAVGDDIMRDYRLASLDRRYDSLDISLREQLADTVCLVGHELANGSCGLDENGSHYHIVCIAGTEQKNSRAPLGVG